VTDLNSRNGTYLNNFPIVSAEISNGDEILVGNTRLLIHLEPEVGDSTELRLAVFHEPNFERESGRDEAEMGNQQTVHVGREEINQEILETRVAATTRSFEPVEIPSEIVRTEGFSRMLLELPDFAILVNDHAVPAIAAEYNIDMMEITGSCTLLFPYRTQQVEKLIHDFFGKDVMFFLNHYSLRTELSPRIRQIHTKFRSPTSFWREFEQLPPEIVSYHLMGMDLVVCESARPEITKGLIGARHRKWFGKATGRS
jgi:hypothetical protein